MEHKAFLSTWCKTFMHTIEKDVFFLNALKISLAPTPQGFQETRCYENNVCTRRRTHLFLLDDGVIFGENIVFVFGSYGHFLSVSPSFSPSFVTMSSSKPIVVGRVNRWTKNSAERRENFCYESLAFSRHNIELVFDEEIMKPERLTEAPENFRIDPGTMRVSKWNQAPTREDDDSHVSSSSRAGDVVTGTNRTSYREREPIEDDEKGFVMKRG